MYTMLHNLVRHLVLVDCTKAVSLVCYSASLVTVFDMNISVHLICVVNWSLIGRYLIDFEMLGDVQFYAI